MRRMQPDEMLALTLEGMPEVAGWVTDYYEGSLEEGELVPFRPYLSGTPVFQPKLGFPQLQAADVLAYEFTLDAKRHFNRQKIYRRRASWRALAYHADTHGGLMVYMDSPLVQHPRWLI